MSRSDICPWNFHEAEVVMFTKFGSNIKQAGIGFKHKKENIMNIHMQCTLSLSLSLTHHDVQAIYMHFVDVKQYILLLKFICKLCFLLYDHYLKFFH